jgi:hypothetical protein
MSDISRAIYWLWKYGGYSGDLSPKSAFELLSGDSNVVLIYVRSEASYGQFFSAIFKNEAHLLIWSKRVLES